MDICGEHNKDIAYSLGKGWDKCPACLQIQELNEVHEDEVNDLNDSITELEDKIDELQEELEEKND